jgi:hypothetical protein
LHNTRKPPIFARSIGRLPRKDRTMRLLTLRATLLSTAAILCGQPVLAQDMAAPTVLPTVNVEGQQPTQGYQPLRTTLGGGG